MPPESAEGPTAEAQEGASLDPEKMEGQEIGGCKIVAKIATGGMGTVYRALQVSMSRQVAIKCLAEDFAKDKQYVTRFVREARAAGELSHTNLIHVLDVGVHQGVYYYIMEFVDGQSLDRILRIKGQLGPETVVEIMLQSAKALSYAHSHDIIHRDIKPDNLMITKEGTVKIADLGIAKKIDRSRESTDAGLVLGTPNYMAPEQATDASLTDRRSDVYALGSTAYHMLGGKPPYQGKNALEILTNVVKKKPKPIEEVRPGLPKHLLAILNKMMARDPERRYQSMEELVKDIEAYKAGKFKSERPASRATTWDDDEDDPKKPKEEIELAATPEEEARMSAAMAPSATPGQPAGGDSIKLSGTRVAPNPGLGSADLIGAKAIGAVKEKEKSRFIPLITLGGAIVIGIVGWMIVKRLTAPPEKQSQGPVERSHVKETGMEYNASDADAKEMFADAEKMAARPTLPRADIIKAFQAVASKYPDSPAGHNAAEKVKALDADWIEAVESRLAEARKYIAKMPDVASVQPALVVTKRAMQAADSRPDLVERVKKVDKDIDEAARTRKDAIMGKARKLAQDGRLTDAIDEAKKVWLLEYEKYQDEPVKDISTWRAKWHDDLETASERLSSALDRAMQQFRGSEDQKTEMAPDKAAATIAAQGKDPSSITLQAAWDQSAETFKDGAAAVDAAWAQIDAMKGQKFRFSKDSFPNNAEVEIVEAQRPKVRVKWGAQVISTKALVHEDIWALMSMNLKSNPAGKQLMSAYLFCRGEVDSALKHLVGAQGPAADKLRWRMEDYQIHLKEAKHPPRDAIRQSGGMWADGSQRGAWSPRENGTEVDGTGEPGERLLLTPPESDYIYEVEARKELGPNGFAMYFKAFGQSYQWHIGDGGNKFSVVRGIPSTQTNDVLSPGDPLLVRIVVLEDRAIGYINAERRWEILKSTQGNPQLGPGAGLGVFSTLIRFRKIRIWDLKDK